MSEEVKLYKLSPNGFDEVSRDQVDYESDDDLFLVDLQDYESERQARLSAETKLRELQDDKYMYESIEEYEEIVGFKVNEAFRIGFTMARGKMSWLNNIQESRTRRQNDDTTI